MSLYRACCCDQASCCSIWCSCPEQITISFCKVVHEKDLYSCLAQPDDCYPPVGSLIGSSVRTITVKDVVFERITNNVDPVTGCSGCCWYQVVTGEEQTGYVSYTRDEWYVWCAEEDGEGCVFGNYSCVGSSTHQLSGTTSNWNQVLFNGRLYLACCDPTKCDSGSVKAKLTFNLEGVSGVGTITDCCTQTTTQTSTTLRFNVTYDWDCRDRSQWVGTCPCDLMEENGTGGIYGEVSSCLEFLTGSCPCGGVQGNFYVGLCIATQSNSIYYCTETTQSLECVPTGNGLGISGCE